MKATVYNFVYFFEEVLPEITVEEACQLLSAEENKLAPEDRYDYGVDLEELNFHESG